MAIIQAKYKEIRFQMQPGDVIAFGGKGHFSEIIKFGTFSNVSHVGTILQTKITDDPTDRFFNQIIESTSLNGFNGVSISRFSDRFYSYDDIFSFARFFNLGDKTHCSIDFQANSYEDMVEKIIDKLEVEYSF